MFEDLKREKGKAVQGVVAGLVLNGDRPLDLTAERDPRIQLRGDVHLLLTLPKTLPIQGRNEQFNWQRTPPLPGPSPGEGDDLVFSGAGSGCDMDDEDECIPVFDTGSGDDLITPVYIPPTLPPVSKPPPRAYIPEMEIGGNNRQPCDDEEDCYIGSGSGEFNTDGGIMTDNDNGGDDMEVEFPVTNHPMLAPDVIHSEEHEPSHTRNKDPGSGSTTTGPTLVLPSTTTTTTTTTSPRTRKWPPKPTPTAYPPSQPQPPPPHYDTDYYEYIEFPEEPESNKPTVIKEDPPRDTLHSDAAGSIPLIISIIAGALIIVILIILLILKLKGRRDGNYKVEETKNYEGIPTMPTPMINGQGNGNIKPGDRRPVKKQSKDVKEWYV
ncbi:hypothetical protein SK128_017155 [Halocaridina rubra]|uniref:Uncharacterized protein n=1 Tax=Halocaridina rubra TaxID=373956 RepID=A0AAN8WVM4_HALRR